MWMELWEWVYGGWFYIDVYQKVRVVEVVVLNKQVNRMNCLVSDSEILFLVILVFIKGFTNEWISYGGLIWWGFFYEG